LVAADTIFGHHLVQAGIQALLKWLPEHPEVCVASLNRQALASMYGCYSGVAAEETPIQVPDSAPNFLSALTALWLYSGRSAAISTLPRPILANGLSQIEAIKMRTDVLAVLAPCVHKKMKCTAVEAKKLVDAWATPVMEEKASAFIQLFDDKRKAAHVARGGADVSTFTSGFGTLTNHGVAQFMNWAPRHLVADGLMSEGKLSHLNTCVASGVGTSAAAWSAPEGSEVLTKVTFGPGADVNTVRAVLSQGSLWRDIHPENDGLGVEKGCGKPPSPELLAACEVETAHLLADTSAGVIRFMVSRGVEVCTFLTELYRDGTCIGRDKNVKVDVVDVTELLEPVLRPAFGGSVSAYKVTHKLVILSWPNKSRAMHLMHLGAYHPGWLIGQLAMGTDLLRMNSTEFVELYRLPLWAALAAIPRAVILGKETSAATLQWEMRPGAGFQDVFHCATSILGGISLI
jgi:hypothetical protein